VAPLTIESNEPIFSADTVNLKQQRVSQGAQRWELSFQIQTKDNEEELLVGMVTGVSASKSMVMPQLNSVNTKTKATNDATVFTTTSIVGSTSLFVNFAQAGALLLPKGSFIKFSGHSKIYMITEDVTTHLNLNRNVKFYPSLTNAVVAGEIMYHAGSVIKPTIQYYRDLETLQGIIYDDGVLVNPGTIRLLEAL
jgi:hypothetical protein